MWAAVIKTTNNLLWRSVASSVSAPKWGQSQSQYIPRRGPCRTCSQGALRRLKPKDVQWSIYKCVLVKRYFLKNMLIERPTFKIYIAQYVHVIIANNRCLFSCTSCVHIITGIYFRRLKINHESHVFILDPGTVANSDFRTHTVKIKNVAWSWFNAPPSGFSLIFYYISLLMTERVS